MHSSRKVELGFFLLLVFIAAALSFLLFKPYLGALFVALVFAIVFRSSYEAIHAKIKRSTLSSLATLLFVFSVILIPAGLFAFLVFDDAEKLYSAAGSGVPMFERFDTAFAPIETYVQKIIPEFEIKLSTYAHAAIAFLVDNFGNVFARGDYRLQTFIMLLALFFLFRDGESFARMSFISPLANEYDERILKRLETAITSVVKGNFSLCLSKAFLLRSVLAFWRSARGTLGCATSIAALIPAFGVALVFIPILIYLFATGSLGITIGFVVFAIFVGAIDNILGPVLFEKGMQMHPLLILLSVLGGLAFFGPVGFLAGPVVLSLLFALLDIYPLLFSEQKR